MWTRFFDMHSGGRAKEQFENIYIEAPVNEAKVIFYNRFGHNPERVTCTCCGEDYSISEDQSLDQATAYERGCDYAYFIGDKEVSKSEGWKPGVGYINNAASKYVERARGSWQLIPLEDYLKQDDVCVVYAADITPEQRVGEVPAQGYVWV